MKVVLMCYHSRLNQIYPPEWVEQFKQSILNQTFKDFEIYEICYSGENDRVFEFSIYESIKMPSFIHAMNYLIEKALQNGASVVANSNCDDVYSPNWLEVQLPFIEQGYDIVSPNFSLMRDNIVYHVHHFENLDIRTELEKNHNIVAHPAVCYSRKFLKANKYNPDLFPIEDMELWRQTIDNFKFHIVSENLLLHRIHSNSVCQSLNR